MIIYKNENDNQTKNNDSKTISLKSLGTRSTISEDKWETTVKQAKPGRPSSIAFKFTYDIPITKIATFLKVFLHIFGYPAVVKQTLLKKRSVKETHLQTAAKS